MALDAYAQCPTLVYTRHFPTYPVSIPNFGPVETQPKTQLPNTYDWILGIFENIQDWVLVTPTTCYVGSWVRFGCQNPTSEPGSEPGSGKRDEFSDTCHTLVSRSPTHVYTHASALGGMVSEQELQRNLTC